MALPKKVTDRFVKTYSPFGKILEDAQRRDVNEADTVTIVKDILADVFGFDKYSEITSEQCVRGTFCDLATRLEDKIQYLIEVKAIGLSLKENHLRQAVQYGATHGIPWVVLTNGRDWEIYRVIFEQPIREELVTKFSWGSINPKKTDDQDRLWLLCKEGMQKSAMDDFHAMVQVVNRFTIAAMINSDSVVDVLRRELSRMAGAKIEAEKIRELLIEVLKRDVLEGDDADSARRRVQRQARQRMTKKARPDGDIAGETGPAAVSEIVDLADDLVEGTKPQVIA